MNVLIACEESQTVCIEFRKLGHNAFSCDILPCSGGHPEWHIMEDVLGILNPLNHRNNALDGIWFTTADGTFHEVEKWDLIIAHPPCTFLTVTGNRWFNIKKYGNKAIERIYKREEAFNFFMAFVNSNCNKIAIENPIGYVSSKWRKPDQIIQPYYFGDNQRKATCLWLLGLPKLVPTNIVKPEIILYKNGKGSDNPWHMNSINLSKDERAKFRSKTFPGIAKAMANQWSNL